MLFMCLMHYVDDHALITKVRPDHRKYAFKLIDDGRLMCGGSFVPNDDGGLFLYEAASLEEARALLEADPYSQHGVVASHLLSEYEVHGVNPALLRPTG